MENTLVGVETKGQTHWRFAALMALTLGLVTFLYWKTFTWWWTEWTWTGSFYAHATFVPFFVAVMIYRNRERLQAAPQKRAWSGAILILFAMLLLFFGERGSVAVVKSLSFVLLLFGAVLMVLGRSKMKILLFPLAFSMMMIPLIPDQLINSIAFPIQITSATMAVKMLNFILLPAHQQGTLIQMDSYRMAVELPCSGFKTLLSLMTFTAAFAYLLEAERWKRWTLFLMTIPLSLVINALRITIIGVFGELVSNQAADLFHNQGGFIVLFMAFFFLYTFARILKCRRFLGLPMNDAEEEKDRAHFKAIDAGEIAAEPPLWRQILSWKPTEAGLRSTFVPLIALNGILVASIGVESILPHGSTPVAPIGKKQVPLQFAYGGSKFASQEFGDFDTLPKEVRVELQPLRVIHRIYHGTKGERIELLITAGNGRKVFHDPHTCSIGNNASLQDLQVMDVPTNHGVLQVQESQFRYVQKDNSFKALFFYVMEDKILQRTEQVRNRLLWQMLAGDSGKPSYFVRVTNIVPGDKEHHREDMKRFITGLWNEIGPILTGQAPTVSEPLDLVDDTRKE